MVGQGHDSATLARGEVAPSILSPSFSNRLVDLARCYWSLSRQMATSVNYSGPP